MKLRSYFVFFIFTVFMSISAQAQWMTDYKSALAKAQAENKAVLINFTGSDWCPSCIDLKKSIFNTSQFKTFADESLVLLEVDFPRRKSLSSDQKEKNQRMAEIFQIEHYPTVFLVDKDGNRLLKTGNRSGGPTSYIAHLKEAPGFPVREEAPSAPNTTATPAARPSSKAAAPASAKSTQTKATPAKNQKEVPAYAVSAPVIRYDKIALKGISGGQTKLALINNQSLSAGEKGRIKVGNKSLEILVKEIRDTSVLVQIEGEQGPRELKMQ